jgi:hypothetical protein
MQINLNNINVEKKSQRKTLDQNDRYQTILNKDLTTKAMPPLEVTKPKPVSTTQTRNLKRCQEHQSKQHKCMKEDSKPRPTRKTSAYPSHVFQTSRMES